MKNLLSLTSLLVCLWSCTRHTTTPKMTNRGYGVYKQGKFVPMRIPDSLLTPKFNVMMTQMEMLIGRHTVVEDNHFVLRLSKRDFRKNGIPGIYFDVIQRELVNNNAFIDENQLDANQLINSGIFKKYRQNPEH